MAFYLLTLTMAGIMNRQCRTVALETDTGDWEYVDQEWSNYGNVTYFNAVRRHAVEEAADSFIFTGKMKIETRDEHDLLLGSKVFTVEIKMQATVLNPRLDTDKITDTTSVVPKRNLLTKFWEAFS